MGKKMDWQKIMAQSTSIKDSIAALKAVILGVEADFAAKEEKIIQTISADQNNTVQTLARIYKELENLVKTTQLNTK